MRAAPLQPLASLVRPSDYPAEAIKAREQGLAIFILSVGPDGKVTGCIVPPQTIQPSLADATCRIMTERARFRPARNESGEAAQDFVPGAVEWKLPAPARKKARRRR